jgi:hypothetical protein
MDEGRKGGKEGRKEGRKDGKLVVGRLVGWLVGWLVGGSRVVAWGLVVGTEQGGGLGSACSVQWGCGWVVVCRLEWVGRLACGGGVCRLMGGRRVVGWGVNMRGVGLLYGVGG